MTKSFLDKHNKLWDRYIIINLPILKESWPVKVKLENDEVTTCASLSTGTLPPIDKVTTTFTKLTANN